MSLDRQLVETIKSRFALKSSAQLEEIVRSDNSERWSPEAIVAAGEVLQDRIARRTPEPLAAEQGKSSPPYMPNALLAAKQVLAADEDVLYGIFGHIGYSGFFPPREFLNEFLMVGCDPCDQDGRMPGWQAFTVSPEEYRELKAWWVAGHPGTVEERLGVDCWSDWVQKILERW